MRGSGAFRAAVSPGGVLAGPWVRDALWREARTVPSLDLRFAERKSLTDAVSDQPLITFTRASSATYVGSDGLIKTATTNEPRFDHNPTTGESLGLLVEEQRTNICVQSEDFGTTWTTNNTTVSTNQITAPDGLTTADKIVEAATTTEHSIRQDTASQSTGTYTISIFAKAGERSNLQFVSTGVLGGFRANFDLANGVLGSVDAQLTASIRPYPNGWYRCIVTATSSTSGALRAQWNIVTSSTAARVESYAGDITKGLFLWGCVVEAGAFPTSYIPTTTATVTRSADVASITGTNFSSWYRQDEGTVFASAGVQDFTQTNFPRLFSIDRGDISSNFISAVRGNTTRRLDYSVFADGIGQAVGLNNGIAPTANTTVNGAWVYKANDFIGAVNGVLTNSDTSGSVPTLLTTLGVGMQGNATLHYNGTIKRLAFFPQRLPNSTLQAITQ